VGFGGQQLFEILRRLLAVQVVHLMRSGGDLSFELVRGIWEMSMVAVVLVESELTAETGFWQVLW
jgi:hypothetical protein